MSNSSPTDSTIDQLTLAEDLVPEILAELDIECQSDTGQRALKLARKHGGLDGEAMSRAPSTIAGGAVYLAARLVNNELPQGDVAAAAGVSKVAIRDSYIEQCERSAIPLQWDHKRRYNDRTPPVDTECADEQDSPSESEPDEIAPDWYDCDLCGAVYRNRAAALQCCGDRFDDDDPPGPVAVPEDYGAPGGTHQDRATAQLCLKDDAE